MSHTLAHYPWSVSTAMTAQWTPSPLPPVTASRVLTLPALTKETDRGNRGLKGICCRLVPAAWPACTAPARDLWCCAPKHGRTVGDVTPSVSDAPDPVPRLLQGCPLATANTSFWQVWRLQAIVSQATCYSPVDWDQEGITGPWGTGDVPSLRPMLVTHCAHFVCVVSTSTTLPTSGCYTN